MMNTNKAADSAFEDVFAKAKRIAAVLTAEPQTAAEINAALNRDYTALQIANAVKIIYGASACKVTRMVRRQNGLMAEKRYAAYYLSGPGAGKVREPAQSRAGQTAAGTGERRHADSEAEYQGKARAIAAVLSAEPMTALEINAALYADYTPLQVANAVKRIPGAASCKVRRMATNGWGEKTEREYTAYFLK